MERSGSLSELEVIGIAAAAAAALGGIVIALGRGQQPEQKARPGLAALTSIDPQKLDVDEVRRTAARAASEIGQHLPEAREVQKQLRKRAKKAAKPARKELRRRAKRASRQLHEVEDLVPSREEAGSYLRDLAGNVTETLRQYAPPPPSRQNGASPQRRAVIGSLSEAARRRVEGSQPDLGTRLREGIVPALQAAAATTASRAGEAVETVMERAEEARAAAANAGDSQAKSVIVQASERGQEVVSTTTQAAKDTLATLGWLSVASLIVYFGLLSPERREKVKSVLCGGLEQARLLALDFRGYEPEA